MSIIMWLATIVVAILRIINANTLGKFDPTAVQEGSDAFGTHFAHLHKTASLIRVERSLIALLSFCVWLRVFKYTRSIPVFGTIGRTIMRAFPSVRPLLPSRVPSPGHGVPPHANDHCFLIRPSLGQGSRYTM
jgi:hypothetical protein